MKKKIWFAAAIILLSGILWPFVTSRYGLTVTEYEIESDTISQQIRIVQLSDVHDAQFGENQSRLAALIAQEEPDLITITGDLVDYHEEDISLAVQLIAQLTKTAPVYVSYGNHEIQYEERYGTDLKAVFEEAGAVVLKDSCMDVTVNGQSLRLGGIYGYCLPKEVTAENEERKKEQVFVSEFQNTDCYTILLCHMPVSWISYGALDSWDVDCVLTGHVHGGQIIFPFLGGLYAPDMGFFPGKVSGIFDSQDQTKHVICSRGLGSSEIIPRWNNVPEIVVLTID